MTVGSVSAADKGEAPKKALAILGDAHHAVFPLYRAIVKQLQEKGFDTDVILDYDVPFAALPEYDMVVLSRYAYNDVVLFHPMVKQCVSNVIDWLDQE